MCKIDATESTKSLAVMRALVWNISECSYGSGAAPPTDTGNYTPASNLPLQVPVVLQSETMSDKRNM